MDIDMIHKHGRYLIDKVNMRLPLSLDKVQEHSSRRHGRA